VLKFSPPPKGNDGAAQTLPSALRIADAFAINEQHLAWESCSHAPGRGGVGQILKTRPCESAATELDSYSPNSEKMEFWRVCGRWYDYSQN
jgi:hypothetical protein